MLCYACKDSQTIAYMERVRLIATVNEFQQLSKQAKSKTNKQIK